MSDLPPSCDYCVNALLTISNPICIAHSYCGTVCGGYREDKQVTNNLKAMLDDYNSRKDEMDKEMRRAVEVTLRQYDLI